MGLLNKGALRKLWSGAKDSVLKKNTQLTAKEKKFMSTTFGKFDLGPNLDEFSDLLAKGKSDKLTKSHEVCLRILTAYMAGLKHGVDHGELNERDGEHLRDTLKLIAKEVESAYAKVK